MKEFLRGKIEKEENKLWGHYLKEIDRPLRLERFTKLAYTTKIKII